MYGELVSAVPHEVQETAPAARYSNATEVTPSVEDAAAVTVAVPTTAPAAGLVIDTVEELVTVRVNVAE